MQAVRQLHTCHAEQRKKTRGTAPARFVVHVRRNNHLDALRFASVNDSFCHFWGHINRLLKRLDRLATFSCPKQPQSFCFVLGSGGLPCCFSALFRRQWGPVKNHHGNHPKRFQHGNLKTSTEGVGGCRPITSINTIMSAKQPSACNNGCNSVCLCPAIG